MPSNGLNLGVDVKFSFTNPNGVIQFAILESFSASENADIKEEMSIDGLTRFPKIPHGWTGNCVFQRNSSVIDDYIALEESGFYLGVDQLPANILQTITEVSGGITQWIFTNVVFKMDNAGDINGTDIIKQTLSYKASRRLKLA